ncbi:zinc-binding dehydrogenase-domain-containing protein [Cladochytrium replicatum]|nr:zinc-binding dehydrogenase-domain-containing protein [Cladochytrium replicatum]
MRGYSINNWLKGIEELKVVDLPIPKCPANGILCERIRPVPVEAAVPFYSITAVQFAKAIGATVIATASSGEKLEICKREGADYVINYKTEKNWAAKVNEITKALVKAGKKRWVGADVVYDPVGLIKESTKCIAWNGRLLVVGFAVRSLTNRLLLKRASLVGVYWGGTTVQQKERVVETWKVVWTFSPRSTLQHRKSSVRLFSPMSATLVFESIPRALAALGERKTYGKVVVELPNASAAAKL